MFFSRVVIPSFGLDRAVRGMLARALLLCCACTMTAGVFAGEPASAASASTVAPSIARTIDQSTHVVIGTVRDVAVVSFYNDILYRLNPEPRLLKSYTAAQLQLEIDTVLYPSGWKPAHGVKYLFGDGMYTVAQIREETLGKRRIYFLRAQDDRRIVDRDDIFVAADAWPLGLPTTSSDQVRRILEAGSHRDAPVLMKTPTRSEAVSHSSATAASQ